jgi:hypothetical protein
VGPGFDSISGLLQSLQKTLDLTDVQCLWSDVLIFTPDQNVRCFDVQLRTGDTFLYFRSFFVNIFLLFACILDCFHNKFGDTLPGLI